MLGVLVGASLGAAVGYHACNALDRALAGVVEPISIIAVLSLFPNTGIIAVAHDGADHDPGPYEVALLGAIILGASAGRYIVPALTGRTIAKERERGTLEQLALTPLRPEQVLSGKLWATALPLVLPFLIAAPWIGCYSYAAGRFTALEVLGYVGWMYGEVLLGVYGSLAFSCICRRAATAVAAAYVLVWTLGPAILIGGQLICDWQHAYGKEAERAVVTTAISVELAVACAAWLIARARIRTLMRG